MKIEDRKLISISRAIGLFMIFEAIFRRHALSEIVFSDSITDSVLYFSAWITIYFFPLVGFLLCITRSLFYFHLAYIANILSLFGTVFTLLPGTQINFIHLYTLLITHLFLMAILIWTHIQIKTNMMNK